MQEGTPIVRFHLSCSWLQVFSIPTVYITSHLFICAYLLFHNLTAAYFPICCLKYVMEFYISGTHYVLSRLVVLHMQFLIPCMHVSAFPPNANLLTLVPLTPDSSPPQRALVCLSRCVYLWTCIQYLLHLVEMFLVEINFASLSPRFSWFIFFFKLGNGNTIAYLQVCCKDWTRCSICIYSHLATAKKKDLCKSLLSPLSACLWVAVVPFHSSSITLFAAYRQCAFVTVLFTVPDKDQMLSS